MYNTIKQTKDCIKKAQDKKRRNIDLYKKLVNFKVKNKVFVLIKN
jgi:hypothetical protein